MQCYGVVGMAFTDADEGVTRLLPTAGAALRVSTFLKTRTVSL